jgi:hypothetical protein
MPHTSPDAIAAGWAPGFGLRPDRRDPRDRALYSAPASIDALPASVDLRHLFPRLLDQKVTSACTGFSGAPMMDAVMRKDGRRRPFMPSPIFLYREARVLGGYVEEDGGAEIRNIWKVAARLGLPPMSIVERKKCRFGRADLADPETGLFPERSIWRRPPPPGVYAAAARRQVVTYHKLFTLADILRCLADGWPVQGGVALFRSMYGRGGPRFEVPDPTSGELTLGGHAIIYCGYDKPSRKLLIRNSWGAEAHEGRPDFVLSFDYVARYGWDAWTGRGIEGAPAPRAPAPAR